jgi:hypothetical protein
MNEIWIRGIGGITTTNENDSSQIKIHPIITMSITFTTETNLELNTGLCSQKQMTNHINYGILTVPKGKHREGSWVSLNF